MGAGAQENRGREAGEERVGSRSSKMAGIIYFASKCFQEEESKMLLDLQLAYFETFGVKEKQKFALEMKNWELLPVKLEILLRWLRHRRRTKVGR